MKPTARLLLASTALLSLSACLGTSTRQTVQAGPVSAQPADANEQARLARVRQIARGWEEKMFVYLHGGGAGGLTAAEFSRIQAELRALPAPASVDDAVLRKNLSGIWLSARHTYRFRQDGTWRMLDGEPGGTWQIQGNAFADSTGARGTIVTVDQRYFIWFDTQGVYLHLRQP